MTKKEYLSILKDCMQNKYNLDYKNTMSIISDYEEYFDSGLNEGKSEEELCQDFGEPRHVALELFDSFAHRKLFFNKRLFYYLSFVVLFVSLLAAGSTFKSNLVIEIVITLLIPLLIYSFSKLITIGTVKRQANIFHIILCLFPAFISFLYWILNSGWYFWQLTIQYGLNVSNNRFEPSIYFSSIDSNLSVLYLASLSGIFLLVLNSWRKSNLKNPFLALMCSGIMLTTLCLRNLLTLANMTMSG